jgi:hypothetical protein
MAAAKSPPTKEISEKQQKLEFWKYVASKNG